MANEAIFVGYRRDDTADVAGRIYDAMAQRFGKQRVFKDVDSIGPGIDFGDYIKTVLPRCRVALVLIGPHWLESKDETGNCRLDDVHDWVRIEIETALATPGVLVVPVLVNGARMPRAEEIPDSLLPLLRRNAAIIRRDPDFHDDVERLATAIRSSVNTGVIDLSKIGGKAVAAAPVMRGRNNRTPLLIGGAISAALVLVAIGFGVSHWLPTQGAETVGEQTATAEPAAQDAAPVETHVQPPPAQQPSAPPPAQQPSGAPPTRSVGYDGAPVRSVNGLRPGEGFRDCSACPEMIIVPGGSFMIGSPDTEAERTDNEGPQRRIGIRQFAVGKFEVTFDEWAACVSAGGCNGYLPGDDGMGRGRRPVIRVSWHDARAYVSWLRGATGQNYRLLSEAEWEYSARAGRVTAYSWGEAASHERANYSADANGSDPWANTAPVGSFAANAFGLFDMHGNVWEWIQDCATAPYSAIAADGAAYEDSCGDRGVRGGAWDNSTRHIRAAQRYGFTPNTRIGTLGFRVARTLN